MLMSFGGLTFGLHLDFLNASGLEAYAKQEVPSDSRCICITLYIYIYMWGSKRDSKAKVRVEGFCKDCCEEFPCSHQTNSKMDLGFGVRASGLG